MSKEKLIKHLKEDIYCRIGVSKIHGVGVIAIKEIPKGVNPFVTLNKKKEKIINLTEDDVKDLDKNTKSILQDFFGNKKNNKMIYDVLYDGPNNINISFYMNHSNKPNINIQDNEKEEYLSFLTNRKIKKGEELFINYNDYDY